MPASHLIDARHYAVQEILQNGMEVQIRSLRPDDESLIVEAFGKLEPDTIRSRYFGSRSGLSEEERRAIHTLDFDNWVVLLVTFIQNGREIVIGSGSYARTQPDTAEVAFLVEEDYHGLGMARCLLRHLALIARHCGIVRFEADVMAGNHAMRRVFAGIGWPMKARGLDETLHITLDLPASEGNEDSHRSTTAVT